VRRQSHPVAPISVYPKLRRLAVGTAAVLALFLVGWWWRSEGQPKEIPLLPQLVATLLDARDCEWATGPRIEPDDRLSVGTIVLNAGVAVIEFDDGARLALQGPATLELQGANAARLHAGSVSVRCEEGAEGFTLLTPTSTVIDLGTEFGVSVAGSGETAVEVLDGEVEVVGAARQSGASSLFLTAGQMAKVSSDGTATPATKRRADWVRDYTSKAEREERAQPPRLLAGDWFQHGETPLSGYTGGSGWAGPWLPATAGPDGVMEWASRDPMLSRSLEVGGALALSGNMEARRRLAHPLDPGRRQRIYVAFSVARLGSSSSAKGSRHTAANLFLRSSSDPASCLGFGLSAQNLWVASDHDSWEKSARATQGAGPFFIVARIDFRPNLGNQIAVAGFDATEPVPEHAPRQWDVVTRRRISAGSHPLDTVALRALYPDGAKFGDVCIGNSWQAVTKPSAIAPGARRSIGK
jgi:hypothetical protein